MARGEALGREGERTFGGGGGRYLKGPSSGDVPVVLKREKLLLGFLLFSLPLPPRFRLLPRMLSLLPLPSKQSAAQAGGGGGIPFSVALPSL